MLSVLHTGTRRYSRRWEVQEDPGLWRDSEDVPLHLQTGTSMALGQALLRASKRLYATLQSAGFACTTPVRSIASNDDGTTLTDRFLLAVDEQRLTACLQLEVLSHGRVLLTLSLAHTGYTAGPSYTPVSLYEETRSLGSLDWALASAGGESYHRDDILEQFEWLGLDEPATLVPPEWQTGLLSRLEP